MSGGLVNAAVVVAGSVVIGALGGVAAFFVLRAAIVGQVRDEIARGTPPGFCRGRSEGLPVPVYCRPARRSPRVAVVAAVVFSVLVVALVVAIVWSLQ